MIEWIQSATASLAEPVTWALIQNTLFLGFVFLILHFFRKASASIRYGIAMIGLIKLIIPPFLPAPFFKEAAVVYSASVDMSSVTVFQPVTEVEQGFVYPFTLMETLFLVWIFITALFILVPLFQTIYWQRKLNQARPVNLLSDTTPCPILMSPEIKVPMTLGILHPKIYVPVQWKQWSPDCRAMILRHELTHIQRKDSLFRVIQRIIQAIYAFHPLVWLLSRKVDAYREMACDDASVGANRSMSVEYARALVQIAESLVPDPFAHASASALIRQRNELLNRVQYQMEDAMKSASQWKTGLIIGALLLMIVPLSWTKSKVSDEPPPPATADLKQSEHQQNDDEDMVNFVKFDTPPQPVEGYDGIQKVLVYPEPARKAGVEGRVMIRAKISETGEVLETAVERSLGPNGCDEAAVKAIKSVEWNPASNQGKPVTVWIAVPVDFKLSHMGHSKTSSDSTH